MREIGIDISKQQSKGLDAIQGSGSILFLIIVCTSAEKQCPATFAPAATRMFWPLDDPTEARGGDTGQLKKFREIRDQIRDHIESWLRSEVPPDWLK